MDFYINITLKLQKGRGLGSRDPISIFWDPLITLERIEIPASNLVQTSRTNPSGVQTIKLPISGRGLGHVTEFRNFGTPLITFERIEVSASNLAQT